MSQISFFFSAPVWERKQNPFSTPASSLHATYGVRGVVRQCVYLVKAENPCCVVSSCVVSTVWRKGQRDRQRLPIHRLLCKTY
ncbi:hypothetical protein V8C42DRAFT_17923 [Trichoderma barbatum]